MQMAINPQQDIDPTGGQPTGAPDFPPGGQPTVQLVPTQRYIIVVPFGPFDGTHDLPPVEPDQIQVVTCDFGLYLPPGTTLIGTPVVSVVEDLYGVDHNPSEIIDANPVVGIAPGPFGTNVTAAAIMQRLAGFLDGARYLLQVTCDRSDGDSVEWYFRVPCVAPN